MAAARVLALCALFFLLFQPADARPLTLADLRKEVFFVAVSLAPDRESVAAVILEPDFANNTNPERVLLVATRDGATRTLATDLYGLSALRWIPGRQAISFLGRRTPDATAQVYSLAIDTRRLQPETDSPTDVVGYQWFSDGRRLLFTRADSPDPSSSAHGSGFVVGDNDYRAEAAPPAVHLWLREADGRTKRLTNGTWSLPAIVPIIPQAYPDNFFSLAADGRHIALTRCPNAYNADADRAVISLLDLADGSMHPLTGHARLESGGEYSPDGRHIAYWYARGGFPIAGNEIYVTSAAGGPGVDVTRELDRSVWGAQWMPDSSGVVVAAHDATQEGLWSIALSGEIRRLPLGELSVTESPDDFALFSAGRDGSIAFVASGPERPSEVYYLTAGGRPRRLTGLNAFASAAQLGRMVSISWTNDGFAEDGVLTYPPGFKPGHRYPLVLQVHGWPAYASQTAFDTDYPGLSQLLAAHGFVVFEPNYRGSDNLGNAFQIAIFNDAGAGPSRDVIAGIQAVERLGIVDERRIGVSGWSYGGFMTAWLISHYSIFKAAMVGGAPVDPNDYAISTYNVLDRHYFGASPWSSRKMAQRYLDQSILPYIWNIHTPTLILADTGDTTVPITHLYELYHGLRDLGVPVQFVAFRSDQHTPDRPLDSEDMYRRWAKWFDRNLQR